MDTNRMLAELRTERDRIDRAIRHLNPSTRPDAVGQIVHRKQQQLAVGIVA